VTVKPRVDEEEKKKTEDELGKLENQRIKIEYDFQVDKIKEETKQIDTLIDFKAKINVAQIEAETARIKTSFEALNNTFSESTDALKSLVKVATGGDLTLYDKFQLDRLIDRQAELQEAAFEDQKKLNEIIRKNLELQNRKLESGDPLINVTVPPEYEAIITELIYSLMRVVQIESAREGVTGLLGLP